MGECNRTHHQGLFRSIIQWGFWGTEHRPDIANELHIEDYTKIASVGKNNAGLLVLQHPQRILGFLPQDANRILEVIGSSPIVSRDYDPKKMVSFMAKLIQQAKLSGAHAADNFVLLRILLGDGDYIDKEVISGIIDWGLKHTPDLDIATNVGGMSVIILTERTSTEKSRPSDTRTAFAIRAGLIEMCLGFIYRFGGHKSFRYDGKSLFLAIQHIFHAVHAVSLHQKTAKAIRSKKISIEEKLVREEKLAYMGVKGLGFPNNTNVKFLLDMLKSILDISGSYCCLCNKSLSKTEVKECDGCHRMAYCSRACQKEDWLNGHSVSCNKKSIEVQPSQFQGVITANESSIPTSIRAAAKFEELEKNITMIQLKLFLDNSESILREARSLDLPLYDCMVTFDLRYCPPMVIVTKSCDVYVIHDENMRCKAFEETRSKEKMTCVFRLNISIEKRGLDGDILPGLHMQRLFPHEWLTSKTMKDSDKA